MNNTQCPECHHFGKHANGCPNQGVLHAKYACAECLEGISKGDEAMECNDSWFHPSCYDNLSKSELFTLLGGRKRTA